MTNKEYEEMMAARKADAYKTIPIEFVHFIEQLSYERGHSAGQGEVDGIACGLVADIKPYIETYNKRVGIK